MPAISPNHDNVEISDLLNLYWNYYELHANQRMKILELFIAIETVLFGVVATAISNNDFSDRIISLAISLIAFICFLLDKRTTDLIHQCRMAIRAIEDDYMNSYKDGFKLFSEIKKKEGKLNYSKVIRIIYLSIGLIGLILVIMSFFK